MVKCISIIAKRATTQEERKIELTYCDYGVELKIYELSGRLLYFRRDPKHISITTVKALDHQAHDGGEKFFCFGDRFHFEDAYITTLSSFIVFMDFVVNMNSNNNLIVSNNSDYCMNRVFESLISVEYCGNYTLSDFISFVCSQLLNRTQKISYEKFKTEISNAKNYNQVMEIAQKYVLFSENDLDRLNSAYRNGNFKDTESIEKYRED